jgi:hypothetical protein
LLNTPVVLLLVGIAGFLYRTLESIWFMVLVSGSALVIVVNTAHVLYERVIRTSIVPKRREQKQQIRRESGTPIAMMPSTARLMAGLMRNIGALIACGIHFGLVLLVGYFTNSQITRLFLPAPIMVALLTFWQLRPLMDDEAGRSWNMYHPPRGDEDMKRQL